jgi:DUF3068 family protein
MQQHGETTGHEDATSGSASTRVLRRHEPPTPPLTIRRAGQRPPSRLGWVAKIALGLGVVVLLVAALWTPVAVPRVVKFPTTTNVHVAYSGSLVTYVDAKTGATLEHPVAVKLAIGRHLQALPAESSSSVALVKETITLRAGALRSTELNVYALNRRTMQAVSDPRAFTFAPGNTPNRNASYYVTLPMGLTSTTQLPIWKPESGTTYVLHRLPAANAGTPSTLDGLSVMWFTGTVPMTPAPAYERSALAGQGLPMSLTPAEVEAQLAAAGVSVSRLGAALAPVLTPVELHTLLAVLGKPVALRYFIFGSGELAAEPRTGTIVKLQGIVDGVAVRPDAAPLATVASILGRHLTVPGVREAVAAIGRIEAAPPQPVYEFRYTQTPASVASMVTFARNQIGQINLATRDLPIGLGLLGILFICLARVAVVVRRRRTAPSPESGHRGQLPQDRQAAA